MSETVFPFSIEIFTKSLPEHRRLVVLPDGDKVRFAEERCPGSNKEPRDILVEGNIITAICIANCGARIEWEDVTKEWVVR